MEKQMKKVKQVAEELNVKPGTVYKWVREGKIEAVKIGRTIRLPGELKIKEKGKEKT